MTHLTADELVDAVDDVLASERRAHLSGCERCREQLAQVTSVLMEVRGVAVPEPSPLFWERLSDNVRRRIAAEGPLAPRVTRWFDWPVLVPLGALAVLIVALVSAVPQGARDVWRLQLAMSRSEEAIDVGATIDPDAHWEMMAALVGDVDLDAAEKDGMTTAPGTAEEAVLQLTSAEQQELVRLLREELVRSGG